MIAVATGHARIDDPEQGCVQLRTRLGSDLGPLEIADPNKFGSLWDWYSYWKSSGSSTYQSRRDYVNSLCVAVVNALEHLMRGEHDDAPDGAEASAVFSERYGYRAAPGQTEVTIREDAPKELRKVVIDNAVEERLDYDGLFALAARIGKKPWESAEPCQSGVSSPVQLARLVSSWDWHLVYDFIEAICRRLEELDECRQGGDSAREFSATLNQYFLHAGIGWQLAQGRITTRGTEAFEAVVRTAIPALEQSALTTSAGEIHKALGCLSRRPTADLTGAIQHAFAALECTARVVSGDASATLGEILKRDPGLIPKPLDSAVEKAWGYASEMGRHLQEGREPRREEVELVVGIAATVATYLSKKAPQP